MAIDLDHLLSLTSPRLPVRWTWKDTVLYGLSLGHGQDPLAPDQLAYAAHAHPSVVPTMGTVLAWRASPDRSSMGIDYSRVVHGEHRLRLKQPLTAEFDGFAQGRVAAAYDRGPDRGAIIDVETTVWDQAGAVVAVSTSALFARADGGFGGPPPPVVAHELPLAPPDHVVTLQTRPEQALLYRLNGDLNPLHADPDVARRAGFDRPILHGLCTYGLTCRAVLEGTGVDPSSVAGHAARFVAPVFPGERVEVRMWRAGDEVLFDAQVPDRQKTVVTNGRTTLRAMTSGSEACN